MIASIYLKNTINKYWKIRSPHEGGSDNDLYIIPEETKALLRENIIESIIQTPPLIR